MLKIPSVVWIEIPELVSQTLSTNSNTINTQINEQLYIVHKGSISCRILFIKFPEYDPVDVYHINPSNHPLRGTSCEYEKSCEFATVSLANGQSGSLVTKISPTLDTPSCLSLVGTL